MQDVVVLALTDLLRSDEIRQVVLSDIPMSWMLPLCTGDQQSPRTMQSAVTAVRGTILESESSFSVQAHCPVVGPTSRVHIRETGSRVKQDIGWNTNTEIIAQ